MSLLVWFSYSYSYAIFSIKLPFSLTLWQHFYSLNSLFVIQETVDTFGLVCLGLLFLSSNIFMRNYMFSIFTTQADLNAQTSVSKGSSAAPTNSNVKLLSVTSSTLLQLSGALKRLNSSFASRLKS